MAVAPAAYARDVQDFQFKLLCRLRIFTGEEDGAFNSSANLVATASKYGLIFVGCPTGIQVITSTSISGLDHRAGSAGEISSYPRREVQLASRPTHLGVSCDQSNLIVAITKDGCAHGLVYSIPSFVAKDVVLVMEIVLSSKSGTALLELTWNPGIPSILATCLGDGSLAAFELKPSGLDIHTQPPATQATCFCWSPKGKQLVVGTEDGTLTQYKPDLKSAKTIQAPSFGSGSVAVVNVLWISTYQFAAIYRDKVNTEERPVLLVVNAPKVGTVSFVNYEDICYSTGELRSPQFYLIHQPAWNIMMVASANSMEVGVLGLQEDQISWEQWTQEDAARAELPLTSDKQDTFPVGMGLDTSTQNELPWGENQSIPPMPVLHILSHKGVLCLFYAINLKPDAARICSPPERLPDESGLALFTSALSPAKAQPETSVQANNNIQPPETAPGGLRINLAPKFDSVGTSQAPPVSAPAAPSLFGQSSSLPATTTPFSSGFTAPTPNFGLAATSSSLGFGSGLPTSTTASSSFTTSLLGSGSTIFGAAATGLATGASNPPATTASAPSLSTFSAGMTNPPSISFGTGLAAKPPEPSNQPSMTFGTGLSFSSSSVPATKPAFSFQTPVTTTAAAAATPPSSKPALVQSSTNFSFVAPGATSTPQQSPKPSQQLPAAGTGDQAGPAKMPTKIEVPTIEAKQTQVKPLAPAVAAPPSKPAPLPAVNITVLLNAIIEEITHFERELAELRSRVAAIKVEVGTNDEKRMLCQKVDSMDEFWRELKETTQAQSMEIRSLKTELLETFAWTEEAKSRGHQLNNPMYVQLTRSQKLDPITARYASNIEHMVYYVENQLRQVNQQLDSNWIEFQESCKPPVKNKMHIPTLEAVYQAMVMQNGILNKQRAIMADITRRAQEQGKCTQIPLISTAVLARARDKEASQLRKGETELSRLAENLVQLKLGPPSMHINQHCRHLSRKKELLLREMLSQRTVTRICPTKPSQSVLGGISTGKPVILRSDSAITETRVSPQSLFGAGRTTHELNLDTRTTASHSFAKTSGLTAIPPNGIVIETNRGEPKTIVDNPLIPKLNTNLSKGQSSIPAGAPFAFSSPVQSGKTGADNFSFAKGLSKVPSVGKLSTATKRLEDYYEEITPPGTPELRKEPSPSPVASRPNTTFTFSFNPSSKPNLLPPSTAGVSLQRSPLSSLDNIVAGIGDNTTNKPVSPTVSQSSSAHTGAFSFGSLSFGQPKSEEIKKPPEAFKFSLPPTFSTTPTTTASAGTGGNAAALKVPVVTTATTGISMKTPLFTSFGTENQQPNTSPKLTIFGGATTVEAVKPAVPFGSAPPNTAGNIFAQAAASLFGGIGTGSPAKQPLPSGNIFGGAAPAPSLVFGKKPADTTTGATVATEPEQKKSESPQKDKPAPTSASDNIFAQSTSLFGSLSMGTPATAAKPVGNIFGGSSATFSFAKPATSENQTTNFSFAKPSTSENQTTSFSLGKQTTVTENRPANLSAQSQAVSSENQETSAEETRPDTTVTQDQKSESPAKDAQPSTASTSVQASSTTDGEKAETSEASSNETASSTTTSKAESTSITTFSFAQVPAITSQASTAAKPLGTSLFGNAVTITPVTPQTSQPATSATTSASSTFTFAIPITTQSSSPFAQKTSVFGQPADSTTSTTTTTSSSTFFGQPICSPSGFGQSGGGSIFGQPATTAVKTNVFGESTTTANAPSVFGQTPASTATTSQSVFGQSSSTPLFGQAASGSSFLGGGTGGFGSKPVFGQSIFGQSGSSGFGSSGTSIFGGASAATGGSLFGGGAASSSGNLFQSSTGGSIFGGASSLGSGTNTGGAFSSGMGQSISQSGFGSPTGFQNKPGGFGGSPVFDRGTSGFGAPPTFGGAPTFGGSPTFGSPGKVFGSTSPSSNISFGSTGQQQSSTFESLATQNTMTFGNIAQNQNQGFGFGSSQQAQPSNTPSFSSNTAFGGNSFTSWR